MRAADAAQLWKLAPEEVGEPPFQTAREPRDGDVQRVGDQEVDVSRLPENSMSSRPSAWSMYADPS